MRHDTGYFCNYTKSHSLKVFEFPSEILSNSNSALQKCEVYCENRDNCWGCSMVCEDKCQWHAVVNCRPDKKSDENMDGFISQKPGTLFCMAKICIQRVFIILFVQIIRRVGVFENVPYSKNTEM